MQTCQQWHSCDLSSLGACCILQASATFKPHLCICPKVAVGKVCQSMHITDCHIFRRDGVTHGGCWLCRLGRSMRGQTSRAEPPVAASEVGGKLQRSAMASTAHHHARVIADILGRLQPGARSRLE